MITQTLTPTGKQVIVQIPEEYINHPTQISVVRLDVDVGQRRKQIDEFFREFETGLSGFKFNREELCRIV
jgi:hypothetical protein